MANQTDFSETIFNAWKTTNRTTIFLIEHIPAGLWSEKVPGSPHRTIGMIASHIHNIRCRWIKSIVKGDAVKVPVRVNLRTASRDEVINALNQSSKAMLKLLRIIIDNGGKLPFKPAWLNFPDDVIHFLTYFAAHEAHHRGQIILLGRQLNYRFSKEVTTGVWIWTKRLKESG
jgi:uncharacterized damage-inducible protein DinB